MVTASTARIPTRLIAAVIAAVGGWIVLASTELGIGVTPDSGHFLATAANLRAGHGFVRLGGELMTSWSPLYPTILALFDALGIDMLVGARLLNAALLASCVLLCMRWVYRRAGRSLLAASVAGIAIALGPPLVFSASLALADLLFATLMIAALEALDEWLIAARRAALYRCTAALGLACLTGYPGLGLLPVVGALALAFGDGDLRHRARIAMAMVVSAGAPTAFWIVRNAWTTGQPFGPRFGTEYEATVALLDATTAVMSWFAPWRLLLLAPAAGGLAFVGLVLVLVAVAVRAPFARHTVVICILAAGAYFGLLLRSVTLFQLDVIGDRMLAPVYAPLIVALTVCGSVFARNVRLGRLLAAAVLMVAASTIALRTSHIVADARVQGPGGEALSNFNTQAWRDSPTMQWLAKHHRPGTLTYSSRPAAVYLHTGVDSRPMPRKHAKRSPGVPLDDLEAIARAIDLSGTAQLVVLNRAIPAHAFTLTELSERFLLSEIARTQDGAVFSMQSIPAAKRHRMLGERELP